jgi:hypothetical protein
VDSGESLGRGMGHVLTEEGKLFSLLFTMTRADIQYSRIRQSEAL